MQYPENEPLPKNICEPCFDKARDTYVFQQVCFKSLSAILNANSELVLADQNPAVGTVKVESSPKRSAKTELIVEQQILFHDVEEEEDLGCEDEVEEEEEQEEQPHEEEEQEQQQYDDEVQEREQPQDVVQMKHPQQREEVKSIFIQYSPVEPEAVTVPPVKATRKRRKEKVPTVEFKSPKTRAVNTSLSTPSAAKKNKYGCGDCGLYFLTYKKLGEHALKMHGGENEESKGGPVTIYMCPKCMSKFDSADHLRSHEEECQDVDSILKPFTCNVCLKKFMFQKELKEHQTEHDDKKMFSCEECGMRFTRSNQVALHMRIHTQEKPFQCPECQMCFSKRTNMVRHMQRHSAERMFACSLCDKTFKWETSLKVHLNTHSQTKMYKCECCSKDFGSSSGYRKHVSTAHQ